MNESPIPNPESPHAIHVVAGVITDARGRILLARRTRGRDLAGLWEFPGGKVEPGETAEAALVRELREELAIEAVAGDSLIAVPQRYPDKRLVLDVRRIARWSGAVKGLDGQALAWVPPHRLATYPMPPADRPVVAALHDPDCYLVTPAPAFEGSGGDCAHRADDIRAAWLARLRQALEVGIARVQLRAPRACVTCWHPLAEQAVAVCQSYGAQVLLNGDAELAQRLGAGLHLPARQLLALQARAVPAQVPLAASCHSVEELRHAQAIGCDFAVVGPVAASASHPGAPGIGWEAFARLREEVSLPIYAIGGMQPADIAQARRMGAQGIAAIRGLWSPDPV